MEWINEYLNSFSYYYCWQVLCILAIYLLGFVVLSSMLVNKDDARSEIVEKLRLNMSLSFIVGVAIFMTIGYVMLTVGIPYNTFSVTVICIVVASVFVFFGIRRDSFKALARTITAKYIILAMIVIIVAAIFATSGIMRISISNDSLYYFWQYPRAIVHFGGLRDQFDNFLTDTGLGAATIGTLPFLYGFSETFGIQEMFHISFLAFLGNAMYSILTKSFTKLSVRTRIVVAAITTVLFAVCTPSYILAHWAMSNMYFMEFYFIALYLMSSFEEKYDGYKLVVFGIILFACSSIRMEGGIFILLLIVTGSLLGVEGKWLALSCLPIVVIQTTYLTKIYFLYNIDNPYTFMTPGKAMIQMAAYILVIVYLLFIRKVITRLLGRAVSLMVIIGLALINGVLFVYDHGRYIGNLKAFAGNLFGQSGWSILPYVLMGSFAIMLVLFVASGYKLKHVAKSFDVRRPEWYYIFNTITFVFITLAVSFARGDVLNVDTGDSGNRVLLQIVPTLLFAVVLSFVKVLELEKIEEN